MRTAHPNGYRRVAGATWRLGGTMLGGAPRFSRRVVLAASAVLASVTLALLGLTAPAASAAGSGSVTNLSLSVSPPSAGAPATYTLNFIATDGLSSSHPYQMEIVAPNGTKFCTSSTKVAFTDHTHPADSSNSISYQCTGTGDVVYLGYGVTAAPGDSITLTLQGVTNPSVASAAYTLTFATNEDLTPVSASYSIVTGTVGSLSVGVYPSTPDSSATYVLNFIATDGLSSSHPYQMEIVAPNGTKFCTSSTKVAFTDHTHPADSSNSISYQCTGTGDVVYLGYGVTAAPGDSITLTLQGVTNPSVASAAYTLTFATNEDLTAAVPVYAILSQGYLEVASDGGIFTFGTAGFHGSMGGHPLNQPIVGIAADPATGGYWEVASDGGIFSFDAPFYGSMGGHPLNQPIVGMAATPDGGGYWEVASDGGIFSFGDAHFYGSMGGHPLNQPIVGMAATPDGGGYWEVASDGGIFSFGDAHFYGSMGGHPLNQPIVGMAEDPATGGYWLVASDGGIFSFDAPFLGSMGGQPLNSPIVGMAATPDNNGYWEVASDGGIFSFGAAGFEGSMGGRPLNAPIVGMS